MAAIGKQQKAIEVETGLSVGDLWIPDDPSLLRTPDPAGSALFHGLRLASRFQPIVSLTHRYPVGHEALLHASRPDGEPVPPEQVFALAKEHDEVAVLDRLCLTAHLGNYRHQNLDATWLFVNISPDVIVDGRLHGMFFGTYLKQLMERSAMAPQRLVIEVPEGAIRDEPLLTEVIHYYRSLGCLIAIDDFGAAYSNFQRIWRIRPDIVKIDRALVAEAAADARARRLAANMVGLLHEAGCLVVMEGVETVEEVAMAMDVDADFVQGRYFSAPDEQVVYAASCPALEPVCRIFRDRIREQSERQHRHLASLGERFLEAVERVRAGTGLADACLDLAARDSMRRCYVLDADGRQVNANLEFERQPDPRYAPLARTIGASWFRRAYFRKALAHPESLQWTGPYLSVTGAHMCITLSYALEVNGVLRVLCCDMDWSDEDALTIIPARTAATPGTLQRCGITTIEMRFDTLDVATPDSCVLS